MQNFRFIKSFSKGQITIPKELRELLGIEDEFWMKLSVDNGKLVAEPVEQVLTPADYGNKLLSIKSDWFSNGDFSAVRGEVEKRLRKNSL